MIYPNYPHAIEFVKKAIKLLETNQRLPVRISTYVGGDKTSDDDYSRLTLSCEDTIALDELKRLYGMDYVDKEPKSTFTVFYISDIFNAEHLTMDDKLGISNMPHEQKVICRCGYILYGEWKYYRKKFWPNLPMKIK